MLDPVAIPQKSRLLPAPKLSSARRQQKLMVIALALLLGALTSILYRDRDFWFPSTEQADGTPLEHNSPVSASTAVTVAPIAIPAPASSTTPEPSKKAKLANHPSVRQAPVAVQQARVGAPDPAPVVVSNRTVLPPLEVEVVAGDARQAVRPGSNSVKVDMQSRPAVRAAQAPLEIHTDPPVAATSAADRARISTVASTVIAESVRPDYPMLARQMKVQGSVILQALIGRDGLIQDLRVMSGPPILAAAAQEAVRQWHFKPHYLGNQAVETQTRIIVNFTISTN
jgi:protein TonB